MQQAIGILLACRGAFSAAQLVANYESVGIGGGGFVDGIFATPASAAGSPTVFTRTDVGGVYRLLNSSGSLQWKPLVDKFTYRQRNWYGVEAVALSSQDAMRLWVVLGAYFEPDELGAGVFESSDGGDSWRQVSPGNWTVRAGSNNSTWRGLGERLAVHPVNENILLYGSYLDGLWRCADAGSAAPSWSPVPCRAGGLPCVTTMGVLALAFDPLSPGGNTVYASVPNAYVMMSTDAGGSWTALSSGPTFARRFALAPPTCAAAAAPLREGEDAEPHDNVASAPQTGSVLVASATDGVWRLSGGAWALSTTPFGAGVTFSGVSVNPRNACDVLALTDTKDSSYGIARSSDGAQNFSAVAGNYSKVYELPWWDAAFGYNATLVQFNWGTMAQNIVWHTDGAGVCVSWLQMFIFNLQK